MEMGGTRLQNMAALRWDSDEKSRGDGLEDRGEGGTDSVDG